jgi:hypothetical protein
MEDSPERVLFVLRSARCGHAVISTGHREAVLFNILYIDNAMMSRALKVNVQSLFRINILRKKQMEGSSAKRS